MRLGFTGTRKGMTADQRRLVKEFLRRQLRHGIDLVHHGDCVGADAEFHDLLVGELEFPAAKIVAHPASDVDPKWRAWKQAGTVLPARPALERNRDIVNAVDVVLAAPDGPERRRSGTWTTIRYADRREVFVAKILP